MYSDTLIQISTFLVNNSKIQDLNALLMGKMGVSMLGEAVMVAGHRICIITGRSWVGTSV